MRALVISGGGSKGAFAGGVAEFLIANQKNKYDIFIGTSAGALLIPLLSISKTEKIKKAFTEANQESIFNVNPFSLSNNENSLTKISRFNAIRMLAKSKVTFGESLNLRYLIESILSPEDFEIIKNGLPEIIVTVSNLSLCQVEYKSAKECNYNDFCDWIWASCNVVPFMSLIQKDGYEYADGGLGNITPLYKAIQMGATEIDVIVLKSDNHIFLNSSKNIIDLTEKTFSFMLNQIGIDDLLIGEIDGIQNDVKINLYNSEMQLTSNSLIFDPIKMKEWWLSGFEYAKEKNKNTL